MRALIVLAAFLTITLWACGKGADERACEHYYEEVFTYIYVFTGPSALVELKKLVVELDGVARDADAEIVGAAANVKDVVTAASETNSVEILEATWAFQELCDRRGFDYDHFHPNQVIE